jgi:hypothetical protein
VGSREMSTGVEEGMSSEVDAEAEAEEVDEDEDGDDGRTGVIGESGTSAMWEWIDIETGVIRGVNRGLLDCGAGRGVSVKDM